MLGSAIVIMIGYLLGSIPFGLVLARAAGLGDIRKIGSGNIGATNVLRTGNKPIAGLTLLCDMLKGLFPVLLGNWMGGNFDPIFGGFAAMVGHISPVWLGFKGGKGVATAAGVLFGWSWPVALIALATWIAAFAMRRISSLSALSAIVVGVIAAWFLAPTYFWAVAVVGAAVALTHHANIRRLLAGTEPKSSFSKQA
jgi:glycerol-3-phosphate acyltransferase PlsY